MHFSVETLKEERLFFLAGQRAGSEQLDGNCRIFGRGDRIEGCGLGHMFARPKKTQAGFQTLGVQTGAPARSIRRILQRESTEFGQYPDGPKMENSRLEPGLRELFFPAARNYDRDIVVLFARTELTNIIDKRGD
jgi:hypothetical protein